MTGLPLKVEELAMYLPHRPPMVWIDTVERLSSTGGVCSVRSHKNAHYFDKSGIRWSAPIEWMAQAYGFVKAAQVATGLLPLSEQPKITFLAQVKDAEVLKELSDENFFIEVMLTRALGPMSLVTGTVRDESREVVAKATLKLFAQ